MAKINELREKRAKIPLFASDIPRSLFLIPHRDDWSARREAKSVLLSKTLPPAALWSARRPKD